MKIPRFTDSQIIAILKQAEGATHEAIRIPGRLRATTACRWADIPISLRQSV